MKILALCGSLRDNSSNFSLLMAIEKKLSHLDTFEIFPIKDLPFFDPHFQFNSEQPEIIKNLRSKAMNSDCILISTPEYAHGIPGILKNALEWLICEETMKKKTAVIIASPSGGNFVKEYLNETLRTMDLIVSPNLQLIVKTARQHINAHGDVLDSNLSQQIDKFILNLNGTDL
jgi:chromate reductase